MPGWLQWWACRFGRHERLLTMHRWENGEPRPPYTLVWVCRHCLRTLGETNWR